MSIVLLHIQLLKSFHSLYFFSSFFSEFWHMRLSQFSKKMSLLLIQLSVTFVLFSQNTVQQAINSFAAEPCFLNAGVSFSAVDCATGEQIATLNPTLSLSPASTTKLFATATAIEVLGSDYAPKTRIYIDGTIQADSVLSGNLWIRGGGDAALGSRYYNGDGLEDQFLQQWADTLLKLGIKKITGSVISDASEFGYQGAPDGWGWSDMGNYYGAGASGLSIYDNMLRYYFKTSTTIGSKTLLTGTFPTIPELNFINYITAGGKGDNSYIFGAPYSLDRFGTGTLEKGANRFVVKGSLPDPELTFAAEFVRVLGTKGIQVLSGYANARKQPIQSPALRYATKQLLYTHHGKTVGSIAWWTNMKSVNLFAESLLCLVGYGTNGVGTTDNSLDKLDAFWRDKINTKGLYINDGSGLSRSNAISADHFCQLLKYMTTSKEFQTFYNTLPIAGVSGTLSTVCKNQPGENRVHAKSGTMNRIKSYAGYVESTSGRRIAFAIIVTNFSCSNDVTLAKIEKVMNTLSTY
jgi:D-alanyl-D-alanine carboxypeptidase/D-alanyl-D-alanine-endopeptidase (penicillin-binding protein 4)